MSTVLRFQDSKMTVRLRKNGDLVYRAVSLDEYIGQTKGLFDVGSTGWYTNLDYPVHHLDFIGDSNSTSLDLILHKGNINSALEYGEPCVCISRLQSLGEMISLGSKAVGKGGGKITNTILTTYKTSLLSLRYAEIPNIA